MARSDVIVTTLPVPNTKLGERTAHHIGSPPTAFRNPWPSAKPIGFGKIISTLFFRSEGRNDIPVPANREGLVNVREPDWGLKAHDKLRATWIGHASFLIETSSDSSRGIRILFDPVFSERTSPVQWFGPKRYSPTPCAVQELPEVDIIAISHNHYDHLDSWTIQEIWRLSKERGRTLLIACALNNKAFFLSLLPDIPSEDVIELDWWCGVQITATDLGTIKLTCTPAQHNSKRGVADKDVSLWCSWVVQEVKADAPSKSLFFAGDTGYRAVLNPNPSQQEEDSMPRCPAFAEIGKEYGPFDLALLPIGLYSPRDLMSGVHCAPEDSICVHLDIRSKRSIGMHYGTVRGGISAKYEDVLEPPIRWRKEGEKKGLKWGQDIDLCDIGETVYV